MEKRGKRRSALTSAESSFFAVSLSVTNLSKAFNKSTHDITTSITLTLLFRPLGAIIFGALLRAEHGRHLLTLSPHYRASQ